jgi:hypothetical protein
MKHSDSVSYINEERAKRELINVKILKKLGKDISKNYRNEIDNILNTKEGADIVKKVAKRQKIQNTVDMIERYEKISEDYRKRLTDSVEHYYTKSMNIKKKIHYINRNSFN